MHRRNLLGLLPFATTLFAQNQRKLKITAVELFRVEGRRTAAIGVNGQHQVQPLHVYDDLRPKPYKDSANPTSAVRPISAIYIRIRTDQGIDGLYGPVDKEAAIVVDQQLKNFLKDKDPLAGETLWDQLYRLNRHARTGHFTMAISAVDNALWDLRGRYFNAPVYRLLGGPTRTHVEAYGSCLGHSLELDKVREKSAQFKREGFRHQKWFFGYGPGDGAEGLANNVALVRTLREANGEETEFMFDAFMGWDLNFALAWAKRCEQYRPRWIEEAFSPDKIASFAELRKATSIPIASGEHFYSRWEVQHYLEAKALHVVQADPEWCGGVSELVKICTLASIHDVHVIPHGHSLHAALHVVASQPPMTCPLVEYLIGKMDSYYFFEKNELRPVRGKFELPDRPGFGIELDPAKVEKQTPFLA
jgi:L-alanine-DL-glutamate epimerase-like enolase superfamily enzyme